MRPVVQRDDCLAACLASLLDLSLDELPEIPPDGVARAERWRDWLNTMGLDLIQLHKPHLDDEDCIPRGYWIGIFGDAAALRKAADDFLDGASLEELGKPPTHAVVLKGNEVAWNPWGISIDVEDFGDLLSGCLVSPLEVMTMERNA